MGNKGFIAAALLTLTAVVRLSGQQLSRQEYITIYAPLAIEQQTLYGIPASITLAQGILESGCGNSRLATEANNHFGIKCGKTWDGKSLAHDDDAPQECFRSYSSVDESYIDHSLFLLEKERYKGLFELDTYDYTGWARGLKAAGYATNPAYADLLIKIIEDNQLYKYDKATLSDFESSSAAQEPSVEIASAVTAVANTAGKVDIDNLVVPVYSAGGYGVFAEDGTRYVIAKNGDTVNRIAKSTGVNQRRLRSINSLSSDATIAEGMRIFIESK